MRNLRETVVQVAAKARKFTDRGLNEQNTKASLIEPMLEALGWDIRDPDEVHHEFRPQGKDNPVDYALKVMRKPRLFVEAKGLGETLRDRRWVGQTLGYAVVAGVEWCVLTDGDEYRIYNATATVDADEKMFFRLRLTEGKEDEAVEYLSLLSRANLELDLLEQRWLAHFVDRRVKAALRDLMATPAKEIIKLVCQRVAKVSEKDVTESMRRMDIRIESPSPKPVSRQVETKRATPAKPVGAKPARPAGDRPGVTLTDLIDAGLLRAPLRLFRNYKGQEIEAKLLPDGSVEFQGQTHKGCSTAAEIARGTVTGRRMNTNGWVFWQFADENGSPRQLDTLRKAFLSGTKAAAELPAPLRFTGASAALAG